MRLNNLGLSRYLIIGLILSLSHFEIFSDLNVVIFCSNFLYVLHPAFSAKNAMKWKIIVESFILFNFQSCEIFFDSLINTACNACISQ